MDPFTIAAIGIAASVASAGVGAVGAIQQGQAQASAANFNAQVARNNAIAAQNQLTLQQQGAAVQEQANAQQSAAEASQLRVNNLRAIASQANNMGASGIDPSGGLDVLTDTATQGEMDAMNREYRGQLADYQDNFQSTVNTYNSQTQIGNYQSQAQLDSMQASNASTGAAFGAAGSLLSGAASLGNSPTFRSAI